MPLTWPDFPDRQPCPCTGVICIILSWSGNSCGCGWTHSGMFLFGFVKIKIWKYIPFALLRINVYTYDYFDYYGFTLKKPSMGRAVMYYGMVFVENYVMISIWYILAEHNDVHVATAKLIVVLAGFWIGIIFMLLHYKYCLKRPNITFIEGMEDLTN